MTPHLFSIRRVYYGRLFFFFFFSRTFFLFLSTHAYTHQRQQTNKQTNKQTNFLLLCFCCCFWTDLKIWGGGGAVFLLFWGWAGGGEWGGGQEWGGGAGMGGGGGGREVALSVELNPPTLTSPEDWSRVKSPSDVSVCWGVKWYVTKPFLPRSPSVATRVSTTEPTGEESSTDCM